MAEWDGWRWALYCMYSFAGFYIFHGWRTKVYWHDLSPMHMVIGMFATIEIIKQILHKVSV